MIAWAIDKFWFSVLCSQCSALLSFEFSLKARNLLSIETQRMSAIFLFVVPLILYALYLAPFKDPKSKYAWKVALERWSRTFFWLVLIFWVWLAECAYAMFSSSLPEWIKSYAEAYQLKISCTVPGLKNITVDGKLGGVFGLLLGLYLFLSRGMPGKTIF